MQLTTEDDLMDHVEVDYKDYFQDMLEYATANKNSNFLEPWKIFHQIIITVIK